MSPRMIEAPLAMETRQRRTLGTSRRGVLQMGLDEDPMEYFPDLASWWNVP